MRILVTGREGQVARSLADRAHGEADIDLTFVGRPEVDLSQPGALAAAIAAQRPDIVLNAAAYTAVDRAEAEEELAFRINALAAGEGAQAAARVGATFLQLSTDYVFDGSGDRPWREDDPIGPINAYGRTKAEGELLVMAESPGHLVVRSSWLVSPFGHNFVKTMLRLASERDEIAVVADQRGCPTSTLDLADGLLRLARRSAVGEARGVYHLAGSSTASWAELADFVMQVSRERGGPSARIRPIATVDYPAAAPRPANSVLDCTRARAELGIVLPDWRVGVQPIVERLGAMS